MQASIAGLLPAAPYQVRVRAFNKMGWGEYTTVCVATIAGAPDAPRRPLLRSWEASTATVTWDDYASDVERGGLAVEYSVFVTEAGRDAWSLAVPRSPISLEATGVCRAQIGGLEVRPIATVVPSSQSRGRWFGVLERCSPAPCGSASFERGSLHGWWAALRLRGPPTAVHATRPVLQPATSYVVRVTGTSAAGTSAPSESSAIFRTLAREPDAPTSVWVRAVGMHGALVGWEPGPSAGGATVRAHTVEQCELEGGSLHRAEAETPSDAPVAAATETVAARRWALAAGHFCSAHTFMATELEPGRLYIFRVRAANTVGASAYAETPVPVPIALVRPEPIVRCEAAACTATSVTLRWVVGTALRWRSETYELEWAEGVDGDEAEPLRLQDCALAQLHVRGGQGSAEGLGQYNENRGTGRSAKRLVALVRQVGPLRSCAMQHARSLRWRAAAGIA